MTTMTTPRMTLKADTAADLMTVDPVSIRHNAKFQEALQFFLDRNIMAAPVIDDSGRPMGVVTVTDLLVHARECGCTDGAMLAKAMMSPETVAELMTPTVFSVAKNTSAAEVVRDMLQTHVRHMFVVDDDQTVIGVISVRDILRHMA